MHDVNAAARCSPFAIPAYRRLFSAHLVSVVGDRLTPVVLAFAVLEVSPSVADLGVVVGAQFVPMIVLTLAGGAFGDRFCRRDLVVRCHLVRFTTQSLTAVLLITGTATVWQLAALQLVGGAATAMFSPVFWGLVPEVVPEAGRANAALNLVDSLAAIVGPALGGVLLGVLAPGWGIAADATTFLVAALLIVGLPTAPRAGTERTPLLRSIVEGWTYVRTTPWLLYSTVAAGLFQLLVLAPLSVLGPVIAETELGGPAAWAEMGVALGAGAAAGAALCLRWHPRRPLGSAFAVSLLAGPVLGLLAIPADRWVLIAAQFAGGMALALFDTWWLTLVQREIPRELISRVLSFDTLGSVALRPLGLFLVGPLAAVMGTGTLLVTACAVNLVITVVGAVLPQIWAVRDRTWDEG